jgi:tetratricopeptide (TPR) repeat protein
MLLIAATAALISGCADIAPAPAASPPAAAAPLPPDDPAPSSKAEALATFERQQREAADAAARQGRWVEAIWAWDVVLVLRPRDAEVTRRRAQAVDALNAALPERLARARAARSRGDLDAAARAYLDVLALAPDHATAADAMREIERERVRRYQLGQPSRAVMARRAPANTTGQGATVEERGEIEHASMLASQGDVKSAIAILQPLAGPRRGSATLRALLADLYLLQAEQLVATDRAGAIAALERSLQADPNQQQAAARLRQLRSAPGPAGAPAAAAPSR